VVVVVGAEGVDGRREVAGVGRGAQVIADCAF